MRTSVFVFFLGLGMSAFALQHVGFSTAGTLKGVLTLGMVTLALAGLAAGLEKLRVARA
jgi:hypothetical protein